MGDIPLPDIPSHSRGSDLLLVGRRPNPVWSCPVRPASVRLVMDPAAGPIRPGLLSATQPSLISSADPGFTHHPSWSVKLHSSSLTGSVCHGSSPPGPVGHGSPSYPTIFCFPRALSLAWSVGIGSKLGPLNTGSGALIAPRSPSSMTRLHDMEELPGEPPFPLQQSPASNLLHLHRSADSPWPSSSPELATDVAPPAPAPPPGGFFLITAAVSPPPGPTSFSTAVAGFTTKAAVAGCSRFLRT
ncbi:unnamed protein product [Linum trigynum]|uniref:Uncharacterized protein n=1 Tax=Linum trigynum TaxID=586398 RepID=A0AAV2ERS0_9ROSI